jgi:hypothetical protein
MKTAAAAIFVANHLTYVVSTADNLRAYLAEALDIDRTFLDKFQPVDWMSALEDTLKSRPPQIPTEVFLKSQRLWLMQKLLQRMNIHWLQPLLYCPAPPDDMAGPSGPGSRQPMSQMLGKSGDSAFFIQTHACL